ncbi:MAG: ABC transporter ATP-binding protein [Oscillospiraceae bacterium]|nr:ABC transporter ATP-binding protein [Oscillospiraceae bacterium]
MPEEKKPEGTVAGSKALGLLVESWKKDNFGQTLDDWKWIFGYTKQYGRAVLIYTILGVLASSLSLISAVASKYTIDIITGYDSSRLLVVLAIMILSFVAGLGITSLVSYVSVRISLRVNNDIQAEVYSAVMGADWMSLSKYPNGDLINRLSSDISTVANNAISWLPDILVSLYTFFATFFVIWHYDRIMALIALASAPFLLLSSRTLLGKMRRHNQTMKEATSELMAFETESLYNIDTIKSMGLTKRYVSGLTGKQKIVWKASLDFNDFKIRTNVLLSLLGNAVRMAIFCYCLYLLWSGKIVYGTMTLFVSQGTRLSGIFNSLAGMLPTFLNGAVSAHRIRELRDLPPEPAATEQDVFAGEAEKGLTVCAEQMDYAYRSDQPVLEQVNFQAKPGEIVAFIGPSGEGKTSTIRLILGLVQPKQGRIYLKGASGKESDMNAETRQYFSYVPQGNTMISGTVADNLRMGREDATDKELEAALKTACAWEFVSRMPKGLYSNVGEKGRGLSEGQAQRIAIARAVLRDAPVLLMDEATSALDVATERQVLKNIMTCSPSKTCILTTHRPSVLTLCRRVYRVQERRVCELTKEESQRAAMDF